MNFRLASLSPTLLLTGALAAMSLVTTASFAQDQPPEIGRVARIEGNISIQPNGVDNWGQAGVNMPFGLGDRVYSDEQSRGEVQVGPVRSYFGPNSDLTLNDIAEGGITFGLAQGSAEVFSDGFRDGGSVQVQTPNGAITAGGRCGFRIDVYPDQQSSIVTNSGESGNLFLSGAGGFNLQLRRGESVQLSGTNPVYAQPVEPASLDDLARWSVDLEISRSNSISAQYVSREMAGYSELDGNGDWQPQSEYGPIWFPHVDAGWAPYRNGHWVNRPFYGWTWVADEPWGAAPFHYGRWVQLRGRWGWIPGAREEHPVWSPAQVVFAGGISVGGAGVSVWFPLGPGEPYRPWYPATPEYINRVNITNIHESNVVHVQNNYTTIINNTTNVTNVTYVNRTVGATAMKQEDFAAGKPAKVAAVHVDTQQLAHVQIARPEAKPPAQPVILHPIAKPAAVQAARPVLINSKGEMAQAVPHAKPMPAPVKAAPVAPRPIPGHAPVGAPIVGNKTVAAPPAPAAKPMAEPAKPVAPPMPAKAPTPVAPPPPAKAPVPVAPLPPARTPPPVAPPPPAARPVTPLPPPARPETPPPAARPVTPLPPAVKPVTPPPPPARPVTPAPAAPRPEPRVVPPPPPPRPAETRPAPPPPPSKNTKKPEEKPKPKEEPK